MSAYIYTQRNATIPSSEFSVVSSTLPPLSKPSKESKTAKQKKHRNVEVKDLVPLGRPSFGTFCLVGYRRRRCCAHRRQLR
jgi:hypothetical protein